MNYIDFQNFDTSMLTGKKPIVKDMSSIDSFFWIHSLINLFNTLNGDDVSPLSFDSFFIDNYVISQSKIRFNFIINNTCPNQLVIHYSNDIKDSHKSPSHYSIENLEINDFENEIFRGVDNRHISIKIRIPDDFKNIQYYTQIMHETSHRKVISIVHQYKDNHLLNRKIELSDENYDYGGFIINEPNLEFEIMFHNFINKAVRYPELFFSLYPEFGITDFSDLECIIIFHNVLAIHVMNNTLTADFLSRLSIIDMASI